MPLLGRASFGYLLRHPWQLGLAILGISIGVAVMLAVDLANESSRRAFLDSLEAVNGTSTHQVLGGPAGLDESVYTRLRVAGTVRDIAPVLSGTIRIRGIAVQLLGVDVFAEAGFRNFATQASLENGDNHSSRRSGMDVVRQLLTGRAGVLIPVALANRLDVQTGDQLELVSNGKTYAAVVLGILTSNEADQLPNLVVSDIAVAQYWLGMQGKLSRIDVRLAAGDDREEQRIKDLLPPGTVLLATANLAKSTAAMSDAFLTNLKAMSLLALLVGVFLIYNSVAFAVLQRRDLIGVLRALGVTRAGVFRLILLEALVIGAIGAALGVGSGIWLGERLLQLVSRTISDHYYAVNVANVAVNSFSIVKGILAGMAATLIAAAVPAIEASSYQPRLAMSRSVIELRAGRLVPALLLSGMLLIGLSVLLLWLTEKSLVAGLVSMFMLIIGFAMCIPLFVSHASPLFESGAARLGGIAGRLAISGIGRSLSRTGVAIVALSIAVSATIGVSIMVGSFRGSVSDWLNTTLQSDVYVGVPRGAMDPALIADIVSLPGVESFSTSRRGWLESGSGRIRLIAQEMAPGSYAATRIRGGGEQQAWQQFDSGEAVLISDAYAFRQDLSRGDAVELNTGRGLHPFSIAGVYQSYDSDNGAIMMSRRTYDRYFDDPAVDSMGLYLRAGVSADTIAEAVTGVSAGRQSVTISSTARIRDLSLRIFDRTFVITNVLYWLAVAVAMIGILGAMLALQLERAREFGVLRAIGMTPRQTGFLITIQSAFIGLLSGLAAIPLGLVMAWMLLEVINRRAFGWQIDFSVAPAALGWAMLLSIGAALIGGIYPAVIAARTRPALAMREE